MKELIGSFIVKTSTFYVYIDKNYTFEEKCNIFKNETTNIETEIDKTLNLYNKSKSKLNNENFSNNAPKNIVEKEQIKLNDSISKLKLLYDKSNELLNNHLILIENGIKQIEDSISSKV